MAHVWLWFLVVVAVFWGVFVCLLLLCVVGFFWGVGGGGGLGGGYL